MRRCYVGEYKYTQDFIELTHCPKFNMKLIYAHPKDFKDIISNIDYSIWTNNPYIVDCFPADEVYVCNERCIKQITQHPSYWEQKDEMTTGKFWSIVGENW